MRRLKYHEQKLLKKTDFYDWKNVSSLKKAAITRKYRLKSKDDYSHYEKIVGYITKMVGLIKKVPDSDPFKKLIIDQLRTKLFDTVI